MAVVGDDLADEVLQNGLVGQVTHIVIVWEQIDDAHLGSSFAEFLGNGLADAFCAAGDPGNFVFKHAPSSSVCILVQSLHQKAHRAETVVAGEHGGFGILHPAVIEVLSSVA